MKPCCCAGLFLTPKAASKTATRKNFKRVLALRRWVRQRVAYNVIGILVHSGASPPHPFHMTVEVDIVGTSIMAVILNPALIAVLSAAPSHQRGLSYPRIVIVLRHIAVVGIVRGIKRRGVAFGEHNDVRVGQGIYHGLCGEAGENAFHCISARFMREDGV